MTVLWRGRIQSSIPFFPLKPSLRNVNEMVGGWMAVGEREREREKIITREIKEIKTCLPSALLLIPLFPSLETPFLNHQNGNRGHLLEQIGKYLKEQLQT